MASPQTENGFTKLANELIEQLSRVQMSGSEWQFIMCLIRKTYGYNKKEDWVTNTQIAAMSGLRKERVSEAKSRLIERKIVTEKRNKISLQKDYEQWVELRKSVSFDTEKRIKLLRKSVPTKERKKLLQNTLGEVVTSPVLEVNKNDMGWNRLPDDEEEVFIDADGDGTAKPEKKKTKKYPNAPAVRKVFLEILGLNPLDWNKNTTQLQACENLYTERGIEKIRNALEFYKEHRNLEYCPSISSPLDLDRKYANLSKFKTKITNS